MAKTKDKKTENKPSSNFEDGVVQGHMAADSDETQNSLQNTDPQQTSTNSENSTNVSDTNTSLDNLQKQILALTSIVTSLVDNKSLNSTSTPGTSTGSVNTAEKNSPTRPPLKRASKDHEISSSNDEGELEEGEFQHGSEVDSDTASELLGPRSPKRQRTVADLVDRVMNKNKEDSTKLPEPASWLERAMQKYKKPQEKGPKVQEEIATLINFLGTDEATQEKVGDIVIPENLKLKTSRVNPEIYGGMSERSKLMEKAFQSINQAVNAGIALVAYSLDSLSDVQGEQAEGAKMKLIDATSTLTRATQSISFLRREALRFEIPSNLKALISKAPNNQDLLFGDDLKEAVDTAEASEKLKNRVSKHPFKHTPKNDFQKGKFNSKFKYKQKPKKSYHSKKGKENYDRDNYRSSQDYNRNRYSGSRDDKRDHRPRQY